MDFSVPSLSNTAFNPGHGPKMFLSCTGTRPDSTDCPLCSHQWRREKEREREKRMGRVKERERERGMEKELEGEEEAESGS